MNLDGVKALCVDDEPNVLQGYQRALRRVLDLTTATSGAEALRQLREHGPFAVIVSDMRMPEMDGVALLKEVRKTAPDTVRIMLTGNADQKTAVDAINEGDVFRFLTKPCDPRMLGEAILTGIQRYKHICAERELLEDTVTGAIQALGEMLAMVNAAAFGRISRIERHLKAVATSIGAEIGWQLDVIATLSQLGCVAISEDLLRRAAMDEALDTADAMLLDQFPELGARMIDRIPRLEDIAAATRLQRKNFDGTGTPAGAPGGAGIPMLARLLRAAIDFDVLANNMLTPRAALEQMQRHRGRYDPEVLAGFERYFLTLDTTQKTTVPVLALSTSMTIATEIRLSNGVLLMAPGQPVTVSSRERLVALVKNGMLENQIDVFVTAAERPALLAAAAG